jgi:hypothetical protein
MSRFMPAVAALMLTVLAAGTSVLAATSPALAVSATMPMRG